MKLVFCLECGDIQAPLPEAFQSRECRCGRHRFWWCSPERGVLRVADWQRIMVESTTEHGGTLRQPTPGWTPAVYILGLHNGFLTYPHPHSKESIRDIIEATPDTYIFRTQESPVIRITPGKSSDTGYAEWPVDGVGGWT